jgi:hypothetical protein
MLELNIWLSLRQRHCAGDRKCKRTFSLLSGGRTATFQAAAMLDAGPTFVGCIKVMLSRHLLILQNFFLQLEQFLLCGDS